MHELGWDVRAVDDPDATTSDPDYTGPATWFRVDGVSAEYEIDDDDDDDGSTLLPPLPYWLSWTQLIRAARLAGVTVLTMRDTDRRLSRVEVGR